MGTKPLAGENTETEPVRERLAIVFADICDSTGLVAAAGDLAVGNALGKFFRRVHEAQKSHHGRIIKTVGDGFLAVFDDAASALAFAISLQHSLARDPILVAGHALKLRIGLHVGLVMPLQTSYGVDVFGADLNVAARLESHACPGEILISMAARLALPEEQQALLGATQRQLVRIKGVSEPLEVSRLDVSQG